MGTETNIATVKTAWERLGAGDFDGLAALYTEDMAFVLPGQEDKLTGRGAFRGALDQIGEALPPGFDVTALHYFGGENSGDVVNVVEWKSNAVPDGTQSAILWRFDGEGRIAEERWYVDTEQWKAAF